MNILIIGGNGTIGKKILSNINLKNHKVFIINRTISSRFKNIKFLKFNYYKNTKQLKKLIKKYKFDIVVNIICFNLKHAERDYRLFKNNIKKYIFVSSTSVYKKTSKKISEDSEIELTSNNYIDGKIKAEKFFINETENFPFIIMRVCQIYGHNNIPTLFKKRSFSVLNNMFLNNKIILIKNYNNNWKMISDDDLGKIIYKVIVCSNVNILRNIFNVVPDKSYTWKKIYRVYSKSVNYKVFFEYLDLKKIYKYKKKIYNYLILDTLKNANFKNTKIFKFIKKPKFKDFEREMPKIIQKQKKKILNTKIDKDISKLFRF